MTVISEIQEKIAETTAQPQKDFPLPDGVRVSEDDVDGTIARLGIAPGVIETIVAQAAKDVDGVAGVGGPKVSGGIISTLRSRHDAPHDVEILAEDDGQLTVEVRVQAYYGYRLQEVANDIREVVFDALQAQAGVEVSCINISITGLQFKPESV